MRYGVKRLILELQYMTSFYCLIRPWQNVIMTFLLHQEIGVMGIIQNDTCDKILSVTLPFYNHNIIPVASNTMDNKMYWINTNAKCSKFSSCYWMSLIKSTKVPLTKVGHLCSSNLCIWKDFSWTWVFSILGKSVRSNICFYFSWLFSWCDSIS